MVARNVGISKAQCGGVRSRVEVELLGSVLNNDVKLMGVKRWIYGAWTLE